MGKLTSVTKEVFVTTDKKEFTNIETAKKHQMDISERDLSPELEKFLLEMFNLPSYDQINDMYESEKEGDYAKGEKMDEKIDKFLSEDMESMGYIDDMDDVVKALIGTYQAFGIEKLSDIFMFIDNKMDM